MDFLIKRRWVNKQRKRSDQMCIASRVKQSVSLKMNLVYENKILKREGK
jgi:hypothetical protein